MASTTFDRTIVVRDAADSLKVSVFFLLVLTVVQRSIGFIRKCFFCGWMAPDELGQWDLAFGFLSLAAPLAVMGLPGSLLRFVDRFQASGQLRTYLRWTMVTTGVLASLFAAALLLFQSRFAELLFGSAEFQRLVPLIALALLISVAFNAVSTFFTAMRLQRIRSVLMTTYGIVFTVLGSMLLLCWQATATSVILAHLLAMTGCFGIGIYWVKTSRHLLPDPTSTDSIGSSFRRQVVPFAIAVWTTNVLANLFPLVDRYMIITVGGYETEEALSIVGQYHVARLLPVFMVSLAQVLQATLIPYLSHDFESGEEAKVSQRLDSCLRLFGLAFFATAAIFLALGPWLIRSLVGDKFDVGLAVLSLALTNGVFTSLFVLAQSYLWCLQKGWLVNAGLVVSLIIGVGLHLILLPRFGLSGAAVASCAGMAFMLVYVVACARAVGMHFRKPTGLVAILPVTLLMGPVVAIVTLLIVIIVSPRSNVLLAEQDKRQAEQLVRRFKDRLSKNQSTPPHMNETVADDQTE